ncbi:MAG TPA: XkdF-like putative serine protease domain-containing protein [Rhizomicrobium sp.]|jgi:hypothetical protein|nr:XkdF-like putative serine protease domain-containing protein [Rhizomicrobium sp.]
MNFRLFIPITKVDVEKRLVYGTVAEEIPDRAGEIMDYESARPEFEAWSAEIAKASDGRSLGNLRAMHDQVAAGKLESLAFDDAAKKIECCGKVVDDGEWKKVQEGVYTGFSMGGKYLNRWKDPANPQLTRYTPKPSEVSLVDNPCIPTATFEVVKEDGTRELRKFRSPDGVTKIGARHSKTDLEHVQNLHDTAVALGATCSSGDEICDDDLGAGAEKLAKRIDGNHDAIVHILGKVTSMIERHGARIAALEAQPATGGPVIRGARTISKSEDSTGAASPAPGDAIGAFRKHLDTLGPQERALALMKFTLANPLSSAPNVRR